GVGLPFSGRALRDRLGGRTEIHRRVLAARAVGSDARLHGGLNRPPRAGAEDPPARHRLRDLDRHRHGRHRDFGHHAVSRERRANAARLHRAHHCRDRRAEARLARGRL
ncbi:MAG: small multidrug resistance family (SMR) protein, partial [uncultured Microvirga sp.]